MAVNRVALGNSSSAEAKGLQYAESACEPTSYFPDVSNEGYEAMLYKQGMAKFTIVHCFEIN